MLTEHYIKMDNKRSRYKQSYVYTVVNIMQNPRIAYEKDKKPITLFLVQHISCIQIISQDVRKHLRWKVLQKSYMFAEVLSTPLVMVLVLCYLSIVQWKIRAADEQMQPPEVFHKKAVLKNFAKFTGKHLYPILFFNKIAGLRTTNLLKKRPWHRCFIMSFLKFSRTTFFQKTSGFLFDGKIVQLLDCNQRE